MRTIILSNIGEAWPHVFRTVISSGSSNETGQDWIPLTVEPSPQILRRLLRSSGAHALGDSGNCPGVATTFLWTYIPGHGIDTAL